PYCCAPDAASAVLTAAPAPAAAAGGCARRWLGILAALLAVPLVAHDRRWLLDSVHDAQAAAVHGSHLFLHFCVGLAAIVALLV
ncbi:hypothetical protein, partial [Pseudomonas syringae group genomosp. 7]|uniref:hypothetical protein n=1 Tax=Pseudomonas syringae group genomosp. 7 TaxID=251699 RepID=UPI00377060BC